MNTNIKPSIHLKWLLSAIPFLMLISTGSLAIYATSPTAIEDFAPATIDLLVSSTTTISETDILTHTITQLIAWDFLTNPFTYTSGMEFSQILWLNDSNKSPTDKPLKYGPGTYLDDTHSPIGRRLPYTPTRNFFGNIRVPTRPLGDPEQAKRFGITITEPEAVIFSGFTYRITWSTPPGDATMDNGNIEATLDDGTGLDCGFFSCSFPHLSCLLFDELWDIDPIKDGETHSFSKPYEVCVEEMETYFSLYIPFIRPQ